jgi:ER-bound oxygenase mpaB/B'/Rubber oxygenase, catalytic domain
MLTFFSNFFLNFFQFLSVFLCIVFLIAYYFYQKKYRALKKRAEEQANIAAQKSVKDWNSEYLQAKRLESDDFADKTVNHVLKDSHDKAVLNKLFATLNRNNQALPEDLPIEIREYFEKSSKLPEWANQDLIDFGQDFYLQNGILICMLLFYKSLPECYTGAKGSLVLLQTAQLDDRSASLDKLSWRLAYTGTFIFRTMMPNALKPRKKGIIATQEIRLIHATVRYYIMNRARSWDVENMGFPINQEDMAGTLMAFSALVLEGLETLGVKMTVTEREAYIHCWRVIGHILGVKEEMIPVNANDALALGHAIINHQMGESEAGVKLTDALLNFCNKKSPRFVSEAFHRSMMRFLMGDKLSDMLGLKKDDPTTSQKFIRIVKGYIRIREVAKKSLFLRFILQRVDKILLISAYRYLSKTPGRNIRFKLPESVLEKIRNKKK